MFDMSFFPNANGNTTVDFIAGVGHYVPWRKPRGKTMAHILIAGRGGDGGKGAVGALAAAGGGGGGGSGAQCRTIIPLSLLPDTLYIYTAPSSVALPGETIVRISQILTSPMDASVLCRAKAGSNGSNSTAAAGGAGGFAGAGVTATNMPLGWTFSTYLAGHAGAAGAASGGAGADQYLPQTGLLVCGGGAGAGIAASGMVGGKMFNWAPYPELPGGLVGASAAARTPDAPGGLVLNTPTGPTILYGGAGSASGWVSATGEGLIQARGGSGAPGCGGGGNGAVFTGGTQTNGGTGGPGFCLITCW